MGCRLAKDETNSNISSEVVSRETMARSGERIDFKARFERKMCLAKETPEPDFDLSECNLKEIPAGVFVLCRVLRKEHLDLSCNKISDFMAGPMSDLSLLQVLNISHNKLKKLPDDLFRIENLRELHLSDNLLTRLPKTINRLNRIEFLDISHNRIESIEEVSCMPTLRILNVSGNSQLREIPSCLSTCDSLRDLILDQDTLEWPPAQVIAAGTEHILKFLTTGELNVGDVEVACEAKEKMSSSREDALMKLLVDRERQNQTVENKLKTVPPTDDGYGNENALIEQLHMRQQKQKQKLLQAVLFQQNQTEGLVSRIQQRKDQERDLLIKDIKAAEQNANLVIDKLLALRNGPDPALLEKERLEEERLLEKLHLEHSELRKQEILATMVEVLHNEDNKLLDYQQKRNLTNQDILERELESSRQLKDFFCDYERNRSDIIQKICEDEELQKEAVATLIGMNDARTWGLVEQLKIVEAQLANMTQIEIDKKTFSSIDQMNELADKRMRLTFVLMDLLDQQESRRKELLDTLMCMEAQKRNEEDFWLLQYQRLIDSRPLEFSIKTHSIDPLLGYSFLVNGVIHCLPFLQKLWQNSNIRIEDLRDDDLKACGVTQEKDRKLILKSIRDFINESGTVQPRLVETPTAPVEVPSTSTQEGNDPITTDSDSLSECVVCMERTVKIIFIPCGHMCCCSECQHSLELCPMCRTDIERRINVRQP